MRDSDGHIDDVPVPYDRTVNHGNSQPLVDKRASRPPAYTQLFDRAAEAF